MGNKINKENVNINTLMERYQIIHSNNQQNITYLQQKQTKKQFILKEITFNEKTQFNKNIDKLKLKIPVLQDHPHVVSLTQYITKSQDQFCSTFYKIYALFQYPSRTLDDQIIQRHNQKRRFAEKQLWSILASCILGLAHLQKSNIKHQSLKSSSILLDSAGVIKIADPYCTSSDSNYYTLLTKRTTQHIYLAPELCESLASQQITPPKTIDPYKSDVFTLGMIILEAGLLQYQDECYRDQGSRIHWQTLNYNLQRFNQIYTSQLKLMIESMINRQEKQRPQWIWLESYVKRGQQVKSNNHQNIINQTTSKQTVANIPTSVNTSTNNSISTSRKVSNFNPSNIIQDIKPVAISNFQLVRPKIGNSPSNIYITHTKIDENLVQMQEQNVTSKQNNISKKSTESINTQYNQFSHINLNENLTVNNKFVKSSSGFENNLMQNKQNINIGSIRNNNQYMHQNIYGLNNNEFSATLPKNQFNGNNYKPINFSQNQPFIPTYTQSIYSNINNIKYYPSNINHNNYTVNKSEYQPYINNMLPAQSNQPSSYSNYMTFNTQQNLYNDPLKLNQDQSKGKNTITNIQSINIDSQRNHQQINQNRYPQVKYVIETFKQGSKYEGEKVNGMRHGRGKFYYQDGGLYDGQWKQNKMSGQGKLFYQSGKIAYDGQWKNDQFCGFGILYNQSPQLLNQTFDYHNLDFIQQYWIRFEGQFQEDLKQGKGKLYLSNNQYFEGYFQKDFAHGLGNFYTKQGKIIKGQWSQNKLVKIF